jgi:phage terminase large subunit
MPELVDVGQREMRSNPYLEFAERYRDDWPGLVREVFGVEPDVWQAEELSAVQRGERRISIRSGHGVGKSAFAAWVCWCAILTEPTVKVVITAPSGPQLWDALFAEIKIWGNQLPVALRECYDFKSERVEHKGAPESIFISARTSRAENPEALQGVHADAGRVILIADEASGVPEAVFEAAAGSMSGHNCTTILLGNPTRSQGFFYDTHTRLASMWRTRRVSCLDSRRVAEDFVEDMKARYGEDSNAFRVRVLGEFPRSDDDTLISLELVETAFNRDISISPNCEKVWGVDVGRFGDDPSALVKRWGKVIPEAPKVWKKLDTMQVVGRIKHEYDTSSLTDRPIEILVDVIGIGSGVVDRLRELGLPARGINVSESPALSESYMKLRDELWDLGKQWLERRDCKLFNSPMFLELTLPKYKFESSGKMKVESKDELKRRKVASPNVADAFLLTLASNAASASGSAGYSSNWSKPLRRGIKGVI